MVWGTALVSQLILRRRADRDGTPLPLRMKGFPGLTVFGLVLLGLIFAVASAPESSRIQLISTVLLIAGIAAACWVGGQVLRLAATSVRAGSRTATSRSAAGSPTQAASGSGLHNLCSPSGV